MRQPKENLIFKTIDRGPSLADVVAQCTGVEGDHSPTHFYLCRRNHLVQMDFLGSHRMRQAIAERSCQASFRMKRANIREGETELLIYYLFIF